MKIVLKVTAIVTPGAPGVDMGRLFKDAIKEYITVAVLTDSSESVEVDVMEVTQ